MPFLREIVPLRFPAGREAEESLLVLVPELQGY